MQLHNAVANACITSFKFALVVQFIKNLITLTTDLGKSKFGHFFKILVVRKVRNSTSAVSIFSSFFKSCILDLSK